MTPNPFIHDSVPPLSEEEENTFRAVIRQALLEAVANECCSFNFEKPRRTHPNQKKILQNQEILKQQTAAVFVTLLEAFSFKIDVFGRREKTKMKIFGFRIRPGSSDLGSHSPLNEDFFKDNKLLILPLEKKSVVRFLPDSYYVLPFSSKELLGVVQNVLERPGTVSDPENIVKAVEKMENTQKKIQKLTRPLLMDSSPT